LLALAHFDALHFLHVGCNSRAAGVSPFETKS
jgi:hypothetical protein